MPGPGKPPAEWERAWLEANRECLALMVEATRRPVSDDPRPVRARYGERPSSYCWELREPLLGAARVAQAEGRLDEAMEYYLAIFRLSLHNAMYHGDFLGSGSFLYSDLCVWVASPGQTAQRVATMLREVTRIIERSPPIKAMIAVKYQVARDLIDGNPAAMDYANLDAKDRMVISLWNSWLPWERERARRILVDVSVKELERCYRLEGDAEKGSPIRVESPDRRFGRAPLRLGPAALRAA